MKRDNVGYKISCDLTADEARRIVEGDTLWMAADRRALVVELFARMKTQGLRLKTIVDYERMLRHKNIDRVCCVILAVTLIISGLFVGAASTGRIEEDTTMGYETRLFDQSRVHTIDIVMNDWDDFLETAASDEYAV